MAVRAKSSRRWLVGTALTVALSFVHGASGEEQQGAASSLASLARGIKLKLPTANRKLDNATVKQLGGEDKTSPQRKGREGAAPESPRQFWQRRYQEAKARILGLELFLKRANGQLASAESSAKVVLERSIRRAETELEIMRGAPEQVITQALAAGGKAEWFAGLPVPEPIFPSWVEQNGSAPITP